MHRDAGSIRQSGRGSRPALRRSQTASYWWVMPDRSGQGFDSHQVRKEAFEVGGPSRWELEDSTDRAGTTSVCSEWRPEMSTIASSVLSAYEEGHAALLLTGRTIYELVLDSDNKIRPLVEELRRSCRLRGM